MSTGELKYKKTYYYSKYRERLGDGEFKNMYMNNINREKAYFDSQVMGEAN